MRAISVFSLVRPAVRAVVSSCIVALPLAAQQDVVASASVSAAPSHAPHAPDEKSSTPLVRVAARALPRGTVLTDRDITLAPSTALSVNAASDTNVRAGWVTRRLVRAGEVLRAPAVAPAPLFAANHPVRFLVKRNGFQLSFDGVAVIAASLGDTIPVRLGAKRRMSGVVSGLDEVVALDSLRNP